MNKIILMLLLVTVSNSAMAEWLKVAYSESGTSSYADKSSIITSGNKVQFSTMYDFKAARSGNKGKTYMSMKVTHEFDCENMLVRQLSSLSYSGNMGSGEVIHANKVMFGNNQDAGWSLFEHESLGEALWEFACSKT